MMPMVAPPWLIKVACSTRSVKRLGGLVKIQSGLLNWKRCTAAICYRPVDQSTLSYDAWRHRFRSRRCASVACLLVWQLQCWVLEGAPEE